MSRSITPGQIVILNGAPRSGKSSIVAAIQEVCGAHAAAPFVPVLYAALYDSIAAHSRLGLNVAVDAGHYDAAILADAAERLGGLPVLFVGIRCPVEVIMERRRSAEVGLYATSNEGESIPVPVLQWQREVHGEWAYDLELDTSRQSPAECAEAIRDRLSITRLPAAFARLKKLPNSDS